MTAPISNEPTTTRLHHYAGHYSVRGGEAPASQTPSAKNADNGGCGRGGLRRCEHNDAWPRASLAREPAISHVNPLLRVWAGLPSVAIAGKRAISSAVVSQIPRLFL